MNNQLLEESGDIDQQVRLFSQNLLNNKIEDEKLNLENEHNRRLQELRKQQSEELERARLRFEDDLRVRLQRDAEREKARNSGTNHELEDAKEEAQRDQQQYIRERKRNVEKSIRETIREQRERFEEEQEQAKRDQKEKIADKYERKTKKVENEQQAIKDDYENRQKIIQEDA